MVRIARLVCCLGAAAGVLVSTAVRAQDLPDQRTIFTFSQAVEVPGATIPAGKYVFTTPNSGIVQVKSFDGKKVYGMFYSVPIQRSEAASKPEVRFIETPAGVAPAIRTWWYPGRRTGHEFIYPKEQARRLAKASKRSVLTTQTQSAKAADTNTGSLARLSSSGEETKVTKDAPNSDEANAAAPSGDVSEGQLAENTATAPAVDNSKLGDRDRDNRRERNRLPATASLVPERALGGILALLGACALGVRRRREA